MIPGILQITNATGVRVACETLIGEKYTLVPFTHNTPFMSGLNDQHWHNDDIGPYKTSKQRHHQTVQLELL